MMPHYLPNDHDNVTSQTSQAALLSPITNGVNTPKDTPDNSTTKLDGEALVDCAAIYNLIASVNREKRPYTAMLDHNGTPSILQI